MIVNKVVSLKLKIGISRSKRLVKLLWLVQSTWEFFGNFQNEGSMTHHKCGSRADFLF